MASRGRPPHPDILTPREWEVLALLRRSLTNDQIAQRLDISPATAKYHVSEIITKLGVATREEAAAWEAERRTSSPLRLGGVAAGAAAVVTLVVSVGLMAWAIGPGLEDKGEGHGPIDAVSPLTDPAESICNPMAPVEKHGPLAIGTGKGVDAICWRDVGGESSYRIEGAVTYWSGTDPCATTYGDSLPTDAVVYVSPEIPFATALSAGDTRFDLPDAPDDDVPAALLGQIKDLRVNLLAMDSEGRTIARDGFAITNDPSPCLTPLPFEPKQIQGGWQSPRSSRKIAHLDSSSRLWISNADGSGREQVEWSACKSGRYMRSSLSWSPLGDRIGVLCPGVDAESVLYVYGAADGALIDSVSGVYAYRWSPDGTRIAYQTAWPGSEPPPDVRIANLADSGDTLIAHDAALLDWTAARRLLLGQHPQAFRLTYSAAWYDPDSSVISSAPEFDDGRPFWIAFDGKTAVVGGKPSIGEDRTRFALAVLNLDTGEEVPIDGTMEFPNDIIDRQAVAINAYEAANQFFWIDSQGDGTMTIHSADLGGARVTNLGTIEGYPIDLSWDGLLLYTPASSIGALVLRDLISGAETALSDIRIGAIRPPQPDDPRH